MEELLYSVRLLLKSVVERSREASCATDIDSDPMRAAVNECVVASQSNSFPASYLQVCLSPKLQDLISSL